ncbi:hypothetical protein [uncultured Mediterranean phage uvDeep-CGR2-KM23-C246]|nr:hypothetical protein [uncultured Mediterranean phage uvDeep-CGR2-KM23-C246]
MKTHLKLTRAHTPHHHNHTEAVIVIAINTILKVEPVAIKRHIKNPSSADVKYDDESNIECLTHSDITLKGKDDNGFIAVEPPEVVYGLIVTAQSRT